MKYKSYETRATFTLQGMLLATFVFSCGCAWITYVGSAGIVPILVASLAVSGIVLIAHRHDIVRIIAGICGGILGASCWHFFGFPFEVRDGNFMLDTVRPSVIFGAIIGWVLACTFWRLMTVFTSYMAKRSATQQRFARCARLRRDT